MIKPQQILKRPGVVLQVFPDFPFPGRTINISINLAEL